MYIAILGRLPALSLAELERLYGSRRIQRISSSTAQIDHPAFDFDRLGGSQKAGRVVMTLPAGSWSTVNKKITQHYLKTWQHSTHKITLGISVYDWSIKPRDIQALGLALKQQLRQHSVSLRLIPNRAPTLNTATSHHNKLGLSPHKVELLIVRASTGEIIIAESIGAQNITALAARDQARPRTDAFVGMLPPKLARIMLNLGAGDALSRATSEQPSHPEGSAFPAARNNTTIALRSTTERVAVGGAAPENVFGPTEKFSGADRLTGPASSDLRGASALAEAVNDGSGGNQDDLTRAASEQPSHPEGSAFPAERGQEDSNWRPRVPEGGDGREEGRGNEAEPTRAASDNHDTDEHSALPAEVGQDKLVVGDRPYTRGLMGGGGGEAETPARAASEQPSHPEGSAFPAERGQEDSNWRPRVPEGGDGREEGRGNKHPRATILDPFCGSGVVLQEALLLGFNAYGSDLSQKMVDYSRTNLDWLAQRYHIDTKRYHVTQADATTASWPAPIDAVICETYLGQPFSAPPSPDKLRAVRDNCNHIITTFLKNIHPQLHPATPLILAIPAWRDTHGRLTRLPLLNSLTDLGYQRINLAHAAPDDLIYYRDTQVVARELLLISRS